MMTDEEIKVAGVQALSRALGSVQAERFIALIQRSAFDYTRWQQDLLNDKTVEEISQAAMRQRGKTAQ